MTSKHLPSHPESRQTTMLDLLVSRPDDTPDETTADNPSFSNGWNDVDSQASDLFSGWNCDAGMLLAEECWEHFYKAGLVDPCGSALTMTRNLLYLVVFAKIYREFHDAFEDADEDESLSDLASSINPEMSIVGYLANQADHGLDPEDYDFDDFNCFVVDAAATGMRNQIYKCLKKAYGCDIKLYQRLCRSFPLSYFQNEYEDDTDETVWDDIDEACLEPTFSNLNALRFVMSGFPAPSGW